MKSTKDSSLKQVSSTILKTFLFLAIAFGFFSLIKTFETQAETLTTSVTVGNAAPAFSVIPFEDPTSSVTSPTDVGLDVTWKATATDSNGDSYYLAICSSDSITPGSSAAPTCGDTTWCTSTSTTSGSQATCSRTTLIGDAYSNAWYGFVCDNLSSGASCSAASQGSGDPGSPFIVNHVPGFTAVNNDSPADPGGSITWTTTASDPDGDNVKLLVCKTAGITGGACTGDEWCSTSTFVTSNPSCTYNIPTVAPTVTNDAYVYVIDEFNFPATSAEQGSNVGFTINNVDPVVSAVTLNGVNPDIDLEAGTTVAIPLTATVSDNNSCQDISAVEGYVYRSSVGYSGCDTAGEADDNYCYPEVTCTVTGGTCEGSTDASADYTCTVNLQYFADPTGTNTQFPSDTWLDTIKATDTSAATGNTELSSGLQMNSLNAFEITASINFGALGVGDKNDPLDKTVTTTPTGNIGMDQEHSGTDMCTDSPTCAVGTPIGVAYQKYALLVSTAYASGTALSDTPAQVAIHVPKPTSTSPTTKTAWWGIEIPSGTEAGEYSGANTITTYKSDVVNW